MKRLLLILTTSIMLINGASATWDNIITVNGDKGYEVILVCGDARLKPYIKHAISEIQHATYDRNYGNKFHFTVIEGSFHDWDLIRDKATFVNVTPNPLITIQGFTTGSGPGQLVMIRGNLWGIPAFQNFWWGYSDLESTRKRVVLHELMHSMGVLLDIPKNIEPKDTIMNYGYTKDTLSSILDRYYLLNVSPIL